MPLILIPARLASTRLPNKPLADIAGEPMIVHVWRRAIKSNVGPVVVATDADEVATAIRTVGGVAVMTCVDHPSGSDRIAEALKTVDPENYHDIVLNLQGDLPTICPSSIAAVTMPLSDHEVDIATICVEIKRSEDLADPNVVKLVGDPVASNRLRALYFTRANAPWGSGPSFHHIGLYAYRRSALSQFISLQPSTLEVREKLEQLRALKAGMRIDAAIVEESPLSVDTQSDLELARAMLSKTK